MHKQVLPAERSIFSPLFCAKLDLGEIKGIGNGATKIYGLISKQIGPAKVDGLLATL